ncbi:MAG TPA: T9SS type A sorting domain-containing protein [Bacteroidia bacterium]|nr:T9SS type A sorting domain-containing protein [Bacteroidia bacterium]
MKKWLLPAFLFLPFIADAQAHEWARNTGTASYSVSNAVAADAFGNVYVTGFYGDIQNNVPFDQVVGGGFIARYSSAGSFIWALPVGGQGMDVLVDDSGYVYVTGSYSEVSLILDTLILANRPFDQDQFILKMDSLGNRIWVTGFGAYNNEYSGGIALDGSGNIFACGSFCDTLYVEDTMRVIAAGPSGQRDIYVVSYDPMGNYRWSTRAGGSTHDEATGIDCDASGAIYVTGSVRGPAMIGSTSITTYLGIADIYIAKLNPAGSFIWARSWGSNYTEYGGGLYVDNNNCAWITGRYYDNNIFISKYTAGGALTFNETPPCGIFSGGEDIHGDDAGHIYMGGYMGAFATFGSVTLNTAGGRDVFIACYDSLGNHNWAIRAGGIDTDDPKRICADPFGNVYHTGFLRGKAGFDYDTLYGLDSLYDDMFLAKLNTSIMTDAHSIFIPEQTMQAYPNPASHDAGIVFMMNEPGDVTLSIFNATGQLVESENLGYRSGLCKEELSLEQLPAGIYLIEVVTASERKTVRLVVE